MTRGELVMLLIFDGGSLMYRMVYAHTKQELSTMNAGGTGAVFFLCKSLRSYVMRLRPASVLMVMDAGYSERRRAILPSYKEGRGIKAPGIPVDPTSELRQEILKDIRKQRAWAELLFPSLGVRKIKFQHREADDIIAKVVEERAAQGLYSIVVSDDRDMYQLVSPFTEIYRPRADEVVNSTNFLEMTGVADPEKWLLWKCLTGDSSDNVPGVPGIGDKTARELVAAGLTFDVDSLLSLAEHRTKRARAVADNPGLVLINRDLLDLNAEQFDEEQLSRIRASWAGPSPVCDPAAVSDWFQRLAFNSILADLPSWITPFQDLR